MFHTSPVPRAPVAASATLAVLSLALGIGLVGIGPVSRVSAAPCAPGPSPSGPTPSGVPECEAPLDPDGSDHATDTVTPGGTVTTDGSHDGATPGDPVETRVVLQNDGTATIDEVAPALAPPTGYTVIGQQVNVSTTDAGPPNDHAIWTTVLLDQSIWPDVDPSTIRAVRDGALVPECDNQSLVASPDPCEPFPGSVEGDDRAVNLWTNRGDSSWLFVVPTPPESAAGTVAAGGIVTTDPENDGATLTDPIETAVETPVAGAVSISEGSPVSDPPAGFLFLGQEVIITAPSASVGQPLRLTFTVDASLLSGQDATTLQVFRDGAAIADCAATDGTATPDPCVADRATVAGDARLVVLSSHASHWDLAVHARYAFSGFFAPVDNGQPSAPVLNSMQAGAAVPVKFSLGGDQGLRILASSSPSSRQIPCAAGATVDPVETTTNAAASGLRYDAASRQYTYAWKTDKGWAATCRRLTVRLIDGTSHSADFVFKK
jgi:hypothetical protein